jgi:hypothetical protein
MFVSKEMKTFRKQQTSLNRFLWNTEVCYRLVSYHADGILRHYFLSLENEIDFSKKIDHVFHPINASAFIPNSRGVSKYAPTVSEFFDHINYNIDYVARSVVVQRFAEFDQYLDDRINTHFIEKPGQTWGSFLITFFKLVEAVDGAAQNREMLDAFCRAAIFQRIRHSYAHQLDIPREVGDKAYNIISNKLGGQIKISWNEIDNRSEILHRALHGTIKRADQNVRNSVKNKRVVPIEYFYAIFTMTALDDAAIEIEKLLIKVRPEDATSQINARDNEVNRCKTLYRN